MTMKRNIYLFIILFILSASGCATNKVVSFSEIIQAHKDVFAGDGISEAEAVVIAKHLIVTKGMDDRLFSLKPFLVERKQYWLRDSEIVELITPAGPDFKPEVFDHWFVHFRDRHGSYFKGAYPALPFVVEISEKTGEVIKWGLKK